MWFKLLPILKKLKDNSMYWESVLFDELTDDEKESVIKGRQEYDDGNYVDFEDYINERI